MSKAITVAILASILKLSTANAHVKSVYPRADELLVIKTALGIATIVQTPAPIQSAVIGDQSGFKVEYMDQAVTIKPLRYAAKTNLYLLTAKQRYNLRLVTLSQDLADYVVYIREPARTPQVQWHSLSRTVRNGTSQLKLIRGGVSNQGFLLLNFEISSDDLREFRPEQFWIMQGGTPKVIDTLYVSTLKSSRGKPSTIAVAISKADIESKLPVLFSVKGTNQLDLQIPREVIEWN